MSTSETPIIRARDVMRAGLVTIEGLATIKEAAEKMRAGHVS
ncbi:MAG: histidine kinase, partial [Desulfobulbaceae bacterium]|nr:histidine kinase [Desulfobulbaceae bacterium]